MIRLPRTKILFVYLLSTHIFSNEEKIRIRENKKKQKKRKEKQTNATNIHCGLIIFLGCNPGGVYGLNDGRIVFGGSCNYDLYYQAVSKRVHW
jgi:hypothetical protein